MKHAIHNALIFGLLAASSAAFGFEGYPQAYRLEPKAAKVGTVITITGRALDKEHVDEVFLTDHRFDMKVKVLEQSDSILKIRIPPFAKPGRLQLLLLSSGDKPAYLEQPLYVQVDEAEAVETPAPVQVTKSAPAPKANGKKVAQPVEIAAVGRNIPVPPDPQTAPAVASTPVKREEPLAQPAAAPAPVPASPVPASPVPTGAPATSVSKGITPPRLIKRAPVSIPSSISTAGDSSVELVVRVKTDGTVGAVKVIRGNPMLTQAAMRSVRDWVYESAYIGSTPVEADVNITMSFKR